MQKNFVTDLKKSDFSSLEWIKNYDDIKEFEKLLANDDKYRYETRITTRGEKKVRNCIFDLTELSNSTKSIYHID